MPTIDIPVRADLHELFELPPCEELKLPKPEPLKITLPTGGTISAFSDISKGIPNDCSMTLSLLLQLGPFLGAFDCLFKVLKLLKPLIDLINGLTSPPPSPKIISDFAEAVKEVAPCFLVPTPLNMLPFVRDVICLIIKVMKCLISQMKSLAGVMGGLSLQLNAAREAGNNELVELLECAQENSKTSAAHLTQSIEPIGVLLDIIGPMMGIVGQQPIKLPGLGSAEDVESINSVIETLQGVVEALQVVADALGGCG